MRKLGIFLLVLVVIIVGLDFGGRWFAESKLAQEVQNRSGLSTQPNTDIGGFSFLWQVVDGRYEHISMSFPSVTVGRLDGVSAAADAYGMKLALSDAMAGNVDNLTASRVDLRALVPSSALSTALGAQGLTIATGPDSTLRLSGTIAIGGQSFTLAAGVTPSIADNVLILTPGKLVGSAAGIPTQVSSAFLAGLTVKLPLTGLPFVISRGAVSLEGSSLVITGSANDVPIGTLIKYSQQGR